MCVCVRRCRCVIEEDGGAVYVSKEWMRKENEEGIRV